MAKRLAHRAARAFDEGSPISREEIVKNLMSLPKETLLLINKTIAAVQKAPPPVPDRKKRPRKPRTKKLRGVMRRVPKRNRKNQKRR